jgi:hypothetical protein
MKKAEPAFLFEHIEHTLRRKMTDGVTIRPSLRGRCQAAF